LNLPFNDNTFITISRYHAERTATCNMSPRRNDSKRARELVHRLRVICIVLFIPALLLNIPHAFFFHILFPAAGLIAHSVSVVLSAYDLGLCNAIRRLGNQAEYRVLLEDEQDDTPRHSKFRILLVASLDLILAFGLLACVAAGFAMMINSSPLHWQHQGSHWNDCSHLAYYQGTYNVVAGGILGAYAAIPFLITA
jgi:hypothetical protein